MNKPLLLTNYTIEFRNSYPELIAQWERQIGQENCYPDLHFCLTLVGEFLKLKAYLAMLEYRVGFAINAYIIHSNWQREFIELGYDENLALELANLGIQLTYKVLNESEEISEHPKGKVYYGVFSECHPNSF